LQSSGCRVNFRLTVLREQLHQLLANQHSRTVAIH